LLAELWDWWRTGTLELVTSVVVASVSLVLVLLHLLWHWRKSDTLWKIWEWVNELSSLLLGMIEGASLTELALALTEVVFAWLSLVVGVNGSESCLAEVFGEWLYRILVNSKNNLRHLAV
jgi:hypothetical protein